MHRTDLIEIHDHPRFPALLRNLATDALEALWNFSNSYRPVLPRLRSAVDAAGSEQILDLCSGAGGPWLRINRDLVAAHQPAFRVHLTDKYPNAEGLRRALEESGGEITFEPGPIDAANVPAAFSGFRTIFSSFHHLKPAEARNVLRHAVSSRQGIGVFELARCSRTTMMANCFIPFIVLYVTPGIRPFRWSRLLFTYVLPVVPLVLCFDGMMSCLRAYPQDEITEMIQGIPGDSYHWELGEEGTGLMPVTYLIGYPTVRQRS